MSKMPKRIRQQNKTVTIYNSKTAGGSNAKKDKNSTSYEQTKNNLENWEFHFKTNELEEVKSILKCNDLSGVPLVIGAAVLNKKDLVGNLLKHGYSINEADKSNNTPLVWAVRLKLLDMIHYLLSNKADWNFKPSNGEDILFCALGNCFWDEKTFLAMWNYIKIYGNIDVNAKNRNGLSMLHLTIRREWSNALDILLASEANVNAITSHGVTPVMLASYRNDYNIVTRLISKGADVNKHDSDGFSALCYAISAAIVKNLQPPYVIVESIKREMENKEVYLADYLKEKIGVLPMNVKMSQIDQISIEQMLQHIITFVMCHVDGGFDSLFHEVDVLCLLREQLEKHIEEIERVKLLLVLLNTTMKTLRTCVHSIGMNTGEHLVSSGCFEICTAILEKYEEDNHIACTAFCPILLATFSHETVPRWMEASYGELKKHHGRFLEAFSTTDMSTEDCKLIKERSEEMLQCFQKIIAGVDEGDTDSLAKNNADIKQNVRKGKRRLKALKSKAPKQKFPETETETETGKTFKSDYVELQPPYFIDINLCVNGIKFGAGLIDYITLPVQENMKTYKMNSFRKDEWKACIHGLHFNAFRNDSNVDAEYLRQNVGSSECYDVDVTIKYLETLLEIIVNKYKTVWDNDRPFQKDNAANNKEFTIPLLEIDIEIQQSTEKEQLRLVHKAFYNLTRNIRQYHNTNPEQSYLLLKELERLLLTHSIRGESIVKQVCPMEVIKVNVTMPAGFGYNLPTYMEQVLNGEITEREDVVINFEEHVTKQHTFEFNGMGDYVYFNDMNGILGNIESDYYLIPAGCSNINECDSDGGSSTCCNKGCMDEDIEINFADSRWFPLIRNLRMMEDCQTVLNGSIRIGNVDKRKSLMLLPSGNFAALEIGLTQSDLPLAVKFVPKGDSYATLLKSQIDPIMQLKHRNILYYFACAFDSKFLILATPLCEYNLGQYVLKMKHTPMKICKVKLVRQMLAGLMYLHDHDEPIVHGNLKPSNVLVDLNGIVRISEFGIHKALIKSKNLPESSIIWFATESYKLYKQNNLLECTCSSDIQVVGMLVHFAMNNGSHPFGKDVVDILKNLEKATPQIQAKDMELYDLLTWMLLGDPCERPSIHQVLSHIYFWSTRKTWRYILTCAGYYQNTSIPMDIEKLHAALDKIALKENIMGNCWVLTAKKQYPQAALIDNSDTPSGLLKFIRYAVEKNIVLQDNKSLNCFILNAFPYFALSLYRMIENTEWSDHGVFLPFHNVVNY